MKPVRRRSQSRTGATEPSTLVRQVIDLFSRFIARTGLPREILLREIRRAWLGVPESPVRPGRNESREILDASHVLTLWYSDPQYLDQKGAPLPLRVRGRAPSLSELIRRVDSSLDVSEMIIYLLKAKALRRSGPFYLPTARAIAMRQTAAPVHERNIRPLFGLLATLEHNSKSRNEGRGCFEFLAENPRVPARLLKYISSNIDRLGDEFMRRMDALLHSAELELRPGEPTVRVGFGGYQFNWDSHPEPERARRARVRRKSSKGRRTRKK